MPSVLATFPPLQFLIDIFESVLLFFHDTVGVGWGLSIVLLTVLVRAALVPLTLRQFRSMQALQRLRPQMQELQKKYKDDKQRLNQEMMAFYKENKVNPLGSCLPLAAQFPVFIGLFYMLRKDLRFNICPEVQRMHGIMSVHADHAVKCGPGGDHGFLFIPDMTDKATGGVLIALIVLYVGSQLASSLLMSVTADKMQRNIMLFLPLIFVSVIISFPAGLIVYWITTNMWTIVQQYIVRKRVGPITPAPSLVGAGGGGGSGESTGLRAMLEGITGQRASTDDGDASDGEKPPSREPARVAAGAGAGAANGRSVRSGPPPPPPRRKKKRSGRRR